mgnify:FL=1
MSELNTMDKLKHIAYRIIQNNANRDKDKKQVLKTAKGRVIYLSVNDISRIAFELQKAVINQTTMLTLITVSPATGAMIPTEVTISELIFMGEELSKFSNTIDAKTASNINKVRNAKDINEVMDLIKAIKEDNDRLEIIYQNSVR